MARTAADLGLFLDSMVDYNAPMQVLFRTQASLVSFVSHYSSPVSFCFRCTLFSLIPALSSLLSSLFSPLSSPPSLICSLWDGQSTVFCLSECKLDMRLGRRFPIAVWLGIRGPAPLRPRDRLLYAKTQTAKSPHASRGGFSVISSAAQPALRGVGCCRCRGRGEAGGGGSAGRGD